jgi:hypothetical protein
LATGPTKSIKVNQKKYLKLTNVILSLFYQLLAKVSKDEAKKLADNEKIKGNEALKSNDY